jgi:hypothetical protein
MVANTARTRINVAGAACLAAGLFGAAATIYLAMVSPVGAGGFTFPHGAPEFTGMQMVIALLRVGLIFGLLGLWWSGAVPATGSARFARYGAFVMMAVLTVAEGLAVTVPRGPLDGTPPAYGLIYGALPSCWALPYWVRASVWPGVERGRVGSGGCRCASASGCWSWCFQHSR